MNSLQHRKNDRQKKRKKKPGRWQYGVTRILEGVQMEFQVQFSSVSRSVRVIFDGNR